MQCKDAAAEDHPFRALFAEAGEFVGLEGGAFAENPGNDARFQRFVSVRGEVGIVHSGGVVSGNGWKIGEKRQ